MTTLNNTKEELFNSLDILRILKSDPAYTYSVENNDPVNLQIVLRAYGYRHDLDYATELLTIAS